MVEYMARKEGVNSIDEFENGAVVGILLKNYLNYILRFGEWLGKKTWKYVDTRQNC
jgi:hypothetical protein